MMRKLMISLVLLTALCFTPVFASEGDTAGADAGNVIDVYSSGELAKVLSSDIAANGPVTVRLNEPKDPYDSEIVLPENVSLDLNGQTVTKNVIIKGNGVSVKNGTIKGGGIDIKAVDSDGSISGVTIENTSGAAAILMNGSGGALAIGDITNNTITNPGQHGLYFHSKAVCGNITGNSISGCKGTENFAIIMHSSVTCGNISGNTITNCADHAIRLMGKSSGGNLGCSIGDITDNVITNCKGTAIALYYGTHCGVISGNKLSNIGGAHNDKGDYGITVNAGCEYKSYAKEITNNELTGITSAGIVVFSGPDGDKTGKWKDNAYIEGDIAGNVVKDCPNKRIKNRVRAAIYVDNHARVFGDIHDNTVDTSGDDGISVISYASVGSIYNNTISNVKVCGLAAKESSTINGDVYNNQVTNSKEQGFMINNKSNVKGAIYDNTFTNLGINGIFVTNSAKAGIVRGNTITKAKTYGIIAGNKGKISQVVNNNIVMNNPKAGMGIICNAPKCLIGKIAGNTITGKYHTGIRVKSPTGKVTITGNTLKTSNPKGKQSTGISCEKAKKLVITKNKITGNKTKPGIYLLKCKGTVKSNTIKNCSHKVYKAK